MPDKLVHETRGFLKNAVVSEDYWLFKVGQHVMTVDGVAGQVQAVEDGPFPGTESYLVVLDRGLGGGRYTSSQLSPFGEIPRAGVLIDAAIEHESTAVEAVTSHTADQDYPELAEILAERPPLERTASVQANQVMNPEQPDSCAYCGGTNFSKTADTGRGTRAWCDQCGGTMTSTAGGQWTADNPMQPGTYPSRAADPRAVINELDVVHGSLGWWDRVGDEDMDSHLGSHGYGSSIMRALDGEDWRMHLRIASLPDFDPEFGFHMRASWADVLAKAKRIRAEGGVRILVATASLVAGEVQGDHHLYESTINYVPGRRSLADWTCGCKWGAYAWGRSPAYRRFEGRRCSHVTALQYEAQSRGMFGREVTPDEERLEGQYQRSPVTVQYQRPTERAPGGNINRRTVPPANMRSEWTERSRVRVKGELAVPGWEGSIGPGPGQYGLPHVYARDIQSGAGNCVCGSGLDDPVHVQAAPGIPIPGRTGALRYEHEGDNFDETDVHKDDQQGRLRVHDGSTLLGHMYYSLHPHNDPTEELPGGTIHAEAEPEEGQEHRERDLHLALEQHLRSRHIPAGQWMYNDETADAAKHFGLTHYAALDLAPVHVFAMQMVAADDEPEAVLRMLGSYGCTEQNANKIMVWAAGMVSTDDGGTPGQLPFGIFTRDSRPLEQEPNHHRHHTNDGRRYAPDFGKGVSSYGNWPLIWCPQCNGSGCGHCGGTGQVYAPGLTPTAVPGPGDMSTTTSPVPDEGRAAGPMSKGTDSISTASVKFFPYHTAEIMTLPNQIWHADTPHSNSQNPGSTGWATSEDPPGWEKPGVPQDVARGDWTAALHENQGLGNEAGQIRCDNCGKMHPAEYSHEGRFGEGSIYSVVCPEDNLTDYYTKERLEKSAATHPNGEFDQPTHAGVALKAADTGRVLMLQRSLQDDKNPDAAGKWEWPGGGKEDGDTTSLHNGIREWEEEVGQPFPEGGTVAHTWRSGPYMGHVVVIPNESAVDLSNGRSEHNPDDPDGDDSEQSAWWDLDHAKKNPALREEVKSSPWNEIKKAAGVMPVTSSGNVGGDVDSVTYKSSNLTDTTSMVRLADWTRAQPGGESIVHAVGTRPSRPLQAGDHVLFDSGQSHRIFATTPTLLHLDSNQIIHRGPTEGDFSKVIVSDPGREHQEQIDQGVTPGQMDFLRTNPTGPSKYSSATPEEHAAFWADEDESPRCTHPWCKDEPEHTEAEHIDPADRDPNSDAYREAMDRLHHTMAPHRNAMELLDTNPTGPTKYSTFHEEPEPALPMTDGATEDDRPEDDAGWMGNATGARTRQDILAEFQQTAGYKKIMGWDSETTGQSEVAAAAKAALAKMGAKDFNFVEQQELINEGQGVRARNFGDLQIEGTHYAQLVDPIDEDELALG